MSEAAGLGVVIEPTSITMRIVDAGDPAASRAWVTLQQAGPHEWVLTGIDVRRGFEGCGYGRALIDNVRTWAAMNGFTVSTRNAMPDVYGFYEKTGCLRIADDEGDIEYLVAPV